MSENEIKFELTYKHVKKVMVDSITIKEYSKFNNKTKELYETAFSQIANGVCTINGNQPALDIEIIVCVTKLMVAPPQYGEKYLKGKIKILSSDALNLLQKVKINQKVD